MARCERCYACQSQWDFDPCKHCGFPEPDKRNIEQVVEDNKYRDMMENLSNEYSSNG